jgi:hypothetical protein
MDVAGDLEVIVEARARTTASSMSGLNPSDHTGIALARATHKFDDRH